MAVPDRHHILARAVNAEMDLGLGRRRARTGQHLAVEIDQKHVIGRDAGTARVARQDERLLPAGDARADMARIVEQIGEYHHPVDVGELRAQRGLSLLCHDALGLLFGSLAWFSSWLSGRARSLLRSGPVAHE